MRVGGAGQGGGGCVARETPVVLFGKVLKKMFWVISVVNLHYTKYTIRL